MKKTLLLFLVIIYKTYAIDKLNVDKMNDFIQESKWNFEENKGQVTGADSKKVNYFLSQGNLTMFLMENGIAYQFNHVNYPKGYKPIDKFAKPEDVAKMNALQNEIRTETYRMDLVLVGANANTKIKTEGKSEDYINYYNHDALDVHAYKKVTYYEVYPKIDWVVYINEKAQANEPKVKYDFVVHPGGDPAQIKLQAKWVEDLQLNEDGSLTMKNRMGRVTEQSPISFQDKATIGTRFKMDQDEITFLLDEYNQTETLIIDPNLAWASYYGGTSSEESSNITDDIYGNIFLSGYTFSTSNIASGGFQNTLGGWSDAYLVKFNKIGTRLWATYFGGANYEYSTNCTTDNSGNIYLVGNTSSTTLGYNGFQNTLSGSSDVYLVKFNSAGIRIWSTYFGGVDYESPATCKTDNFGSIYIGGVTTSTSGISYLGHQGTLGGGNDAFLVKFNSLGSRVWATYYGGSSNESFSECVLDKTGNIYAVGSTMSSNNIASSGYQNFLSGNSDAFLVKFNNVGVRQWATYLGGIDYDYGVSCDLDTFGNIYMAGNSQSLSGISLNGHQNAIGGGTDAYLAKFNNAGSLIWSTYYGGSNADFGSSVKIDNNNSIYLGGYTFSSNAISSGGFQNTSNGGQDCFLAKFNVAGVRQWATYFGGNYDDALSNCVAGKSKSIYICGRTSSNALLASGGFQNNLAGDPDGFIARITDCAPSSSNYVVNGCDSFYWTQKNKMYYTSNNTDTVILINATGCDSTVTLKLTMNKATYGVFNVIGCDGYYWEAKYKYYTSENTTDTIVVKNFKGCDSVVRLNLTIRKNTSSIFSVNACGSFYWTGKKKMYYSSNNSDTIKLVNAVGCDSIVYLDLTIQNKSASIYTIDACDTFYWPAKKKGYNASNNTDTIMLKNRFGCDSIVVLSLTIQKAFKMNYAIKACDSFYWQEKNKWYKTSNTTDTIKRKSQFGCDSVITLNLTVFPAPNPTIIKNGNSLSTQLFEKYQWLKNGVVIPGAVNQNFNPGVSGDYAVEVTDVNECTKTSASISMTVSSLSSIHNFNISLFPNPIEGILNMDTRDAFHWKCTVFDSKGMELVTVNFMNATQLNLTSFPAGVYLLQFENEQAEKGYYKIVKE